MRKPFVKREADLSKFRALFASTNEGRGDGYSGTVVGSGASSGFGGGLQPSCSAGSSPSVSDSSSRSLSDQ
jgi:hypothetical protein